MVKYLYPLLVYLIRSLSSVRANFSMENLNYEKLPEAMAEEVVKMKK